MERITAIPARPHPFLSLLLPALFVLAALTAGPPAHAAAGHELSAGVSTVTYSAFFRGTPRAYAIDLSYHHPVGRGGGLAAVRLGGGLRAGWPLPPSGVPLELYARCLITGDLGVWQPAAGPELGFSGFASLDTSRRNIDDAIYLVEASRVAPLYLAFDAAPLRFRFGRLTLSVLELQIGASMLPPGAAARLQLGLIHVGGTL